ncbi:MAG TPA: class I SAM-dependent methyltransferase [Dehalococcoidia bacterium]|nr:class I SAM-dependent methyltransferase [Dehalococcoidia bacterium]
MTEERDAFAERVVSSVAAAMDVFSTYLGEKLGFYRALAEGPLTADALAAQAACSERYAREWLEHQAVTGILRVEGGGGDEASRRYALPAGHAEVLLDRDSLSYVGPIVRLFVGAVSALPSLLEAYRTGGGVAYADYGVDLREGQGEINRPVFLQQLPHEWIPAMPDVHARLMRAGAKVADLGCGAAWSAIGIARAYPAAQVDAFDLDPASVALARSNVDKAGLGDRVRVQLRDAGDAELAGQYDLVAAFETIHDMSRPVEALGAMRRLAASGGGVMVVDERVGETFTAPADELERLMYGWSILHCLPAGMAEQPSAGTGTVLRPGTLRAYAREAGFADVETLPLDAGFFNVYRLV